ncbi:MAG: 2-hydroxychromene-2-carboxylate isomerase [Hyphomicrobiaceae bacterium]|nr:2-hydroxychromene-2-carboxylate isomerase [Hyphomicrobiaceae bacterium]
MTRCIEFWFDFASTYSYLSAMRLPEAAKARGVDVVWRPFLLGPIFKSNGWSSSPFNVFPAKGRYMVRDIERIAASRGLTFQLPDPFPQNSLMAARTALAIPADDQGRARFARAVFEAQFSQRADISSRDVIARCLATAALPSEETLANAETTSVKMLLRSETERAAALGIFGAPTFVTADSEVWWGDDRLDAALAHHTN